MSAKSASQANHPIASRFRGYLPVVVDVETGGFNPQTDALLEVSASCLTMDTKGNLMVASSITRHLTPFEGANIEEAALKFTKIDIHSPVRIGLAEDEKTALTAIFKIIRHQVRLHNCTRAVLVGHNASFDLSFINAAAARCGIKRNPFHPFTCLDTASLAALAYGQTVLAKACEFAGIEFDAKEAHSASYDTEKTAELFCTIVNKWQQLGGWQA